MSVFYGSCIACEKEHCHCWDGAYDDCGRCMRLQAFGPYERVEEFRDD